MLLCFLSSKIFYSVKCQVHKWYSFLSLNHLATMNAFMWLNAVWFVIQIECQKWIFFCWKQEVFLISSPFSGDIFSDHRLWSTLHFIFFTYKCYHSPLDGGLLLLNSPNKKMSGLCHMINWWNIWMMEQVSKRCLRSVDQIKMSVDNSEDKT